MSVELVHFAKRYLLDSPLDSQTADFRVGFQKGIDKAAAVLNA